MSLPGSGAAALSEGEIALIVRRLAAEISRDHEGGIVLVGLLKGSVCLVADLARSIEVPCAIDFLALSPYGAGGERVALAKDLDVDVTGRDVVVAVDIVDRGLTVSYVLRLLAERGAAAVDICTLLDRRVKRLIPVELRYVGAVTGEEYLIGYGLDLEERLRNVPSLVEVDPREIRHSPPESLTRFFEG
jgi:hypoxanthine phosphoribosyltransferase